MKSLPSVGRRTWTQDLWNYKSSALTTRPYCIHTFNLFVCFNFFGHLKNIFTNTGITYKARSLRKASEAYMGDYLIKNKVKMLSSTHRSKAKQGNPKPLDPGPQTPSYEPGLWTTLQTIKISFTGCLINNSRQRNFECDTVQIQVQAQELVILLYTLIFPWLWIYISDCEASRKHWNWFPSYSTILFSPFSCGFTIW